MKELSIEEKAKKYDEALKFATIYHKQGDEDMKTMMETCFPELKESEDERIRKDIVTYLAQSANSATLKVNAQKFNKWIAWIEKQGEQKSTNNQFTPEQASILDKHIDKFLEQKPADKVEPKFHEGDWISGYYTNYKVLSVNNEGYIVEDTDGNKINILFENEKFHHLFIAIADAKNGDVLSDGTTIFIFKDLLSDGSVMSYCDYDANRCESDAFCPLSMNLMCCSKITPATKEQRDTLEKAMADAGYTFDFKEKVLKKIEQKHTPKHKVGDTIYYNSFGEVKSMIVANIVTDGTDNPMYEDKNGSAVFEKDIVKQKPTEWSEEDNMHLTNAILAAEKEWGTESCTSKWLKSIKDRVQPQPKQEWNEEDEEMIEGLNNCLDELEKENGWRFTYVNNKNVELVKIRNWLKSLRLQNNWKPSDEQMDALRYVTNFDYGGYKAILVSLYEQLKKLKG